ncbi:MAG: hypothetical protein IJ940_06770 [Bacteroidales bacterium]|nr:hypothetical protein [Bacteroidales bacterium]
MKQTRIIISAIVFMSSVFSGCTGKDVQDGSTGKPRLQLEYPSDAGDTCPKIRFGNQNRKDEKSLAYERIAEEWNRNLIMGNRVRTEEETAEPFSGLSQR